MRKVCSPALLLLCALLAHPASAHVIAGGYEADSCTPHGVLFDNNVACAPGTFSGCKCTYVPEGGTAEVDCPGAYPDGVLIDPPAGTYHYHRLTTCSPAAGGPPFPPFTPVVGEISCGHMIVTTIQTDPVTNTQHIVVPELFLVDGVYQNDWGHDCNPIADAGAAQTVCPGEAVTLDGKDSHDPNDDPLTWAWTEVGGTTVTLSGVSTATPTFSAPATQGTLSFKLTVKDPYGERIGGDGGISSDTTTVTVLDDGPAVTTADVTISSRPSHEARAFSLSDCVTSVLDTCDGALDADAAGQITQVTSGEPGGTAQITGPSTVELLPGSGAGRTYTIDFVVYDSAGNATPASCRVSVLQRR